MRALFLLLATVAPAFAGTMTLDLPVACVVGKTCFIQQYPDHDPGKGAKDYKCGPMTYDGHDGLDIRLPSLAAQQRGVDVLAAAPGTVKGVRDGMADISVRLAGAGVVAGRECGNGVVIAHQDGWETQYCHMAKASLLVHVGDVVQTGTVLGRIGESGDAEFPHVHFAVRHDGQKLDPFAYDTTPGQCGAGQSLWSVKARASLVYRAPQLLNQGFAGAPVSMDDIESGRAEVAPPDGRGAALVAFVRTISLLQGDVQELSLTAPNGSVLVSNRTVPLDHDKAQWMFFVGKKRPATGFAPGRYAARYTISRGGRLVLERSFSLDLH